MGYLGHELDISGSRDVIGHVTIRFPTGHFPFASSDSFYEDAPLSHDRQTTDEKTLWHKRDR